MRWSSTRLYLENNDIQEADSSCLALGLCPREPDSGDAPGGCAQVARCWHRIATGVLIGQCVSVSVAVLSCKPAVRTISKREGAGKKLAWP